MVAQIDNGPLAVLGTGSDREIDILAKALNRKLAPEAAGIMKVTVVANITDREKYIERLNR